jgi:hypothetical protein
MIFLESRSLKKVLLVDTSFDFWQFSMDNTWRFSCNEQLGLGMEDTGKININITKQ